MEEEERGGWKRLCFVVEILVFLSMKLTPRYYYHFNSIKFLCDRRRRALCSLLHPQFCFSLLRSLCKYLSAFMFCFFSFQFHFFPFVYSLWHTTYFLTNSLECVQFFKVTPMSHAHHASPPIYPSQRYAVIE